MMDRLENFDFFPPRGINHGLNGLTSTRSGGPGSLTIERISLLPHPVLHQVHCCLELCLSAKSFIVKYTDMPFGDDFR